MLHETIEVNHSKKTCNVLPQRNVVPWAMLNDIDFPRNNKSTKKIITQGFKFSLFHKIGQPRDITPHTNVFNFFYWFDAIFFRKDVVFCLSAFAHT